MSPPNTEQTRPLLELGKRRQWEEALVTLINILENRAPSTLGTPSPTPNPTFHSLRDTIIGFIYIFPGFLSHTSPPQEGRV